MDIRLVKKIIQTKLTINEFGIKDSFDVELVTLEQIKKSRKEWVTQLNWNSEKCGGFYFSHADSSTIGSQKYC